MRYNFRALRGLSSSQHKNIQATATGERLLALNALQAVIEGSALRVHHVERLLGEIDAAIKRRYEDLGYDTEQRAPCEKKMLVDGHVPEELFPVVETLLVGILPRLRDEADLDRVGLFLSDYSWLGMGAGVDEGKPEGQQELSSDLAGAGAGVGVGAGVELGNREMREKKLRPVDVVRKVAMPRDRKRERRCVRCCEVSEDAMPAKGSPQWLSHMMRMCVCGSGWAVYELGQGRR